MIIMRYNGGLGNQMFQYAAIYSLADKLGLDFAFDASFFKKHPNRTYQMFVFGIKENSLDNILVKLAYKFRKFINTEEFFNFRLYNEKSFNFEPRFNDILDNTSIVGFFQSHKYINEELIKKTFTFKLPLDEKNADILNNIKKEDSISLHIRRGDYVKKKRYANEYAHLSLNYYKNAMELIAKNTDSPVIYVFSDDIEWATENLNFEDCPICLQKNARFEFVSHNTGSDSYKDMQLMSNCKHNIIANSSFSWWGAYLNNNPKKIVIAPKLWFQDEDRADLRSLYPASWHILDC